MKQATKKVLAAALELPEKEKIQVAEELLAAIDGEADPDAARAWEEEIARRTLEIERGEVKPVPWSVVKERLAERVRGKR
jgi:putative addiction module component (TIGR02574 family)